MAGEQAGRRGEDEPDPGTELRYELLANLMSDGIRCWSAFFSGSSDLAAGLPFFQCILPCFPGSCVRFVGLS
jgi:hypothetical protein